MKRTKNTNNMKKMDDIDLLGLEPVDTDNLDEEMTILTAAKCLNRIYKVIFDCNLTEEAVNKLSKPIEFISKRFGIMPKGAILLACVVERNGNCDKEDLARYLGCSNIEFIEHLDALREMEEKGVISVNSGHRRNFSDNIVLSAEALKSIEDDTEYKPVSILGLTTDELFTKFRRHFNNFRKEIIGMDRLIYEIKRLVDNNEQLLFCRKVTSDVFSKCKDVESLFFVYLCHRYVTHGNASVEIRDVLTLADYTFDDMLYRRQFSNQKTNLQQEGLVCFGINDGFADENYLALSDKVKYSFFCEVELKKEESVKNKDLIPCDTIKEENLFYNPEEGEQIARLESLLEDDNFRKVQERLEAEGMPKGFCAVFHGCPGSGKTASLKALAKKTGRDLFWVDLSAIKSKWVGESEQNIKHLFDTYRQLVKTSEKTPILAVNEADGIFTKRITNVMQSTDNMYNSMTDIVLNEMEKLDGIMIATTNLAGNMMDGTDNAMERRFLFKIKFDTPAPEVRAKIWKSKIKDISDEDAAELGKRYTFSGGNIENIARKCTVDYILGGKRADLETIIKYCEEESISKKNESQRKIGFSVNSDNRTNTSL